jgi:hypothetical protein
MNAEHQTGNRFNLGDWVSFDYGSRRAYAQLIEDRGELGANRSRIYRVQLNQSLDQPPLDFEMPEEDLSEAVSKASVIDYLKQRGGLVAILKENMSGGRDQPRAWLTITSPGNISHTFIAARGMVGGATVPFYAMQNGKIFRPKTEEIAEFLAAFGLNRKESEDIIRSVGTFP